MQQARDRILAYLRANVGAVVTSEELHYVAEIKDFPRRVRELRTEEGFSIATVFTGRPDLKPGEYVLETLERIADPHDRGIADEVRTEVYARDRNTCQSCGRTRVMWTRDDARILELHHCEQHVYGGANEAENLAVLCSRCHDEVHAGRLAFRLPHNAG